MSYTNIATVKQYMGLNFDSGLDSFVQKMIDGAGKYIERFCGDDRLGDRFFAEPEEETVRKFDGNGQIRMYIGDVLSISSLVVDGVALTEDEDYFLYPDRGESSQYIELAQPATRLNSRVSSSNPYIFEYAQKNVEITGLFAYSETAPADIEVATLKIASAMIKENTADKNLKDVKSESLGDYSVSYADVQKIANSLSVDTLLEPYVRTAAEGAVHSKGKQGAASAGIIRI